MKHLAQMVDSARLRRFWEVEPFHSTGLGDISDIFGTATVSELLDRRGLRLPFVGMIVDGEVVADTEFARDIGTGPGAVTGIVDQQRIMACLDEGATMVLRGLRMYDHRIDDLCCSLQHELGHPVYANAYLTPRNSRGAAAHADPHTVVIRQVEGSKHWTIRRPASDGGNDSQPVLAVDLEPGQSLYIPRGFIHEGQTDDRPSLHLTLNFGKPYRWLDALVDLLREATPSHSPLDGVAPITRAGNPLQTDAAKAIQEFRSILDDRIDVDKVLMRMQEHLHSAMELSGQESTDVVARLWQDSDR